MKKNHQKSIAPSIWSNNIHISSSVLDLVSREQIDLYIAKHQSGQWGLVSLKDRQANYEAIKAGTGRVISWFFESHIGLFKITTNMDIKITDVYSLAEAE